MTRVLRWTTNRMVVVAVVVATTTAVVLPALIPTSTSGAAATEVSGNATHYYRLGSPYGGCGLPQEMLDSVDFVALNVFDTPGDYTLDPGPSTASEADKIGRWDNGRNCGRFVRVTIGDYCTGINDGARAQPFCRDGSWIGDGYNGATLTMVVADSCRDATAWCRDDPDHLGLSTASLTRFEQNGTPMGAIDPVRWNNRQVSWSYVPAPNYSGDLRVGFLRGAQPSWPVIAVSNLPNGIHGVEYLSVDGSWRQARPNMDMGQSFVIGPTGIGDTAYRIRVRDASDALVNNGRVYSFDLPAECSRSCAATYTPADHDKDNEAVTSSRPSATSTTTTTAMTAAAAAAATATATTDAAPTAPRATTTVGPITTVGPTTPVKTTTPAKTTTQTPSTGCTVTAAVVNSWPGAHQSEFTVTNTGSSALSAWSVAFSFAGNQRMENSWNAKVSQTGRQVVADNQDYNGTVAAGKSTTWGAIVSGVGQPLSGLRCTVH